MSPPTSDKSVKKDPKKYAKEQEEEEKQWI